MAKSADIWPRRPRVTLLPTTIIFRPMIVVPPATTYRGEDYRTECIVLPHSSCTVLMYFTVPYMYHSLYFRTQFYIHYQTPFHALLHLLSVTYRDNECAVLLSHYKVASTLETTVEPTGTAEPTANVRENLPYKGGVRTRRWLGA